MSLLRDHPWALRYTPEDGVLAALLYVPALRCAQRYDRTTGYFSARALTLAARGIEYLVANGGRMRLVIGCTLAQPEVAAIEHGQCLRDTVQASLLRNPLQASRAEEADALALLAWMVAHGHLEAKVAVPCDEQRRPLHAEGLFHEKAGIVEDKTGDRIAFNGSLNETESGWTLNWESLNVFTSWRDLERVDAEEASFAKLWADRARRVMTFDIPTAVRDDLLRFLPPNDAPPERLRVIDPAPDEVLVPEPPTNSDLPIGIDELRRALWGYIRAAARLPGGGARVGETTAAVEPWPHQVRAFHRLYDHWPPRLLIADEVGLGKTIQAGLLLRQAWLAGKARRVLVMAPASVCRQWQIELREKFNLNWPIYDGHRLQWQPSPAEPLGRTEPVTRTRWHEQPFVIASSHLMRRRDRLDELVNQAAPWDLVVLDEAHHARRKGFQSLDEQRPNSLLRLMRDLAPRAPGLVLLTATPMQVHAVEVFDLLRLLGLPPAWSARAFLEFFDLIEHPSPSNEGLDRIALLMQACEQQFGSADDSWLCARLPEAGRLRIRRVLDALRSPASIPRRMLSAEDRRVLLKVARLTSPVSRLISRHTRGLLRRYHQAGKLATRVATRAVTDHFIPLSAGESALYAALDAYILQTYNAAAPPAERAALGFVLTVYRRRLASSVSALVRTLEKHLHDIRDAVGGLQLVIDEEDEEDLDAAFPEADNEELAETEQAALAAQEAASIDSLLRLARSLPPDSKLSTLQGGLNSLHEAGYAQAMVFTQYTDTMDFLREQLAVHYGPRLMCFSGRGGEVRKLSGEWQTISRDEIKRRFRDGQADVLLCTDAAAEGLNFQFCGALINYDMPWNPMRVEQRIGRIDRLGQRFAEIRVHNLHYDGTIEADVYRALGNRIDLFQSVVGRLQPILSQLPSLIANRVLEGRSASEDARRQTAEQVERDAADAQASGFDLDAMVAEDLELPSRPASALTLEDLGRLLQRPELLPPEIEVRPLGSTDWRLTQPGLPLPLRITTDRRFFDEHAGSVELWSPGSPVFPEPECAEELVDAEALISQFRSM